MISSSEAYRTAVVGTARRTYVRAIVDIVDPGLTIGGITATSEAANYSRSDQITNRIFVGGDMLPTLELNRTLLGGEFTVSDDLPYEEVGFISEAICDANGSFSPAQTVTLSFSEVEILQNMMIAFPGGMYNGVASAFRVDVLSGDTVIYTKSIAGNTSAIVTITGFSAENPTAIRVVVQKWSIPYRRARIIEIFPGLREEWSGRDIAALSITQQANFASVALPYGTCTISVDNRDRRFEPSIKNSIFKSLEERQGIDVDIGVKLPDGTIEYKRVGRFFQNAGGWKTGNNGLTIQWSLVDIVGLLANREYIPPSALPTTVGGWISSIVSQLGAMFDREYIVDADIAGLDMVAANRDSIVGQTCGGILMWVAQASGSWIHADAATGRLALRKLPSSGGTITLANLENYPTTQANSDAAAVIVTLPEESQTQIIVYSDNPASDNTLSVQNPFITSEAQARASAAFILESYGGNAFSSVGRGDPASELGDVDRIEVTPGNIAFARRVSQTFDFSSGVLRGCQSTHIEVGND